MTRPGCSRRGAIFRDAVGRCCRPRPWRRPPSEFIGSEDRDQARAAFIKAVEVYSSLGAAADVARLQASVPRPRHPPGPARQAPAGAQRLGQPHPDRDQGRRARGGGLSNPEIATKLLLSRRTVATHVSHILRKLGVNSRIDIAREAAMRTTTPE